jgi:hypothetical protein
MRQIIELLSRFGILTAVTKKNVIPCAAAGSFSVSEEFAASVFIFIKQLSPSSCQFNEKWL